MQTRATLKFNGELFNGTIYGSIMDALNIEKMSDFSVKNTSHGKIIKYDGKTYECDFAPDSDEYLFFMCESF